LFTWRRNSRSRAHDVEADRRLVEIEDLWVVQQRRGDVSPHPLAKRQLAHGDVEQRLQVEQLDELLEVGPVSRAVHPVDAA